jgi:hypothetical protein
LAAEEAAVGAFGAADVDLDLAALVEESVQQEAVETETDLAVASFVVAAAAASWRQREGIDLRREEGSPRQRP